MISGTYNAGLVALSILIAIVASYAAFDLGDRVSTSGGQRRWAWLTGGAIAMANSTAGGFVGKMFNTIARFIAPSGMPSPLLWGDEDVVRERFGSQVCELRLARRHFTFDYPFPPSDVVNFFRLYYGPVNRAFASLDRAGRMNLNRELEAIWSEDNRGRDGFTLIAAEYLEVLATRG